MNIYYDTRENLSVLNEEPIIPKHDNYCVKKEEIVKNPENHHFPDTEQPANGRPVLYTDIRKV